MVLPGHGRIRGRPREPLTRLNVLRASVAAHYSPGARLFFFLPAPLPFLTDLTTRSRADNGPRGPPGESGLDSRSNRSRRNSAYVVVVGSPVGSLCEQVGLVGREQQARAPGQYLRASRVRRAATGLPALRRTGRFADAMG